MMKQNDWTDEDAAIVKGMAERGDEQHNIAAWFGVNHGRISEIVNGKKALGEKFKGVLPTETSALPPPGPYNSIIEIAYGITKVSNLKNKISDPILLRKIKALQSVLEGNFERVAMEAEKRKHSRKKNKEKAAKKNKKIKRQERVAEVLKNIKPLNF